MGTILFCTYWIGWNNVFDFLDWYATTILDIIDSIVEVRTPRVVIGFKWWLTENLKSLKKIIDILILYEEPEYID